MTTCFGHPCDHHQANFYRSCAFNVLIIWDPIMCTFFVYGLKSLLKVFTGKTFNSDFSPYIKNDVHIMGSHIISTLKAHDL